MGVVGAITAIAALGTGIVQSDQQRSAQTRAGRRQDQAQKESVAAAAAAQRRAEMESRKANQRTPDVSSLLADEQKAALAGPSSTMLTGSSPVTKGRMKLGSTSLLGS